MKMPLQHRSETRTFGLIGVPSSAGAHWPGQEKAPQCLRDAGLVEQIASAGLNIIDHGDLPRIRWQPDPERRRPHHRKAVLDVARNLAAQVEHVLHVRQTPLVIGGDCTISIGVLSGFLRQQEDIALVYFDGGVDLGTPVADPTGDYDSMGVAHMIGAPGTAEELVRIGPRVPLMPDDNIVLFGYTQDQHGAERTTLARRNMSRYPVDRVRGRPTAAAAEARAELESKAAQFVIHFDVDVIDFVDFPVADVPQVNEGLMLDEALDCLSVFAASPQFGGLVVTEFNPDHADEEGRLAARFAKRLAQALTGCTTQSH